MLEGRINQLPLGLLSYFGIKTGGRYPGTLGSELAPTLELFHLYSAQKKLYLVGGLAGVATTGFFTPSPVTFVVPNSALWIISGLRASANAVGTATLRLSYAPPINVPQQVGGIGFGDASSYMTLPAAGGRMSVATDWSGQPLGGRVFSPGWRLGIDVLSLAGPFDMALDMEYFELPF